MQSDLNIVKGGPPPGATPTEDLPIWNSAPKPINDARVFSYDQESIAWDYRASSLPTIPSARLLRNKLPYVLRSPRNRRFYDLGKRGLDVIGALVLLLFTSPLFLVAAILIKLNSSGPVFFKHKRIGPGGNEFWCLKFRTMVADAEDQLKRDAALREQFEESFKIKDDRRITGAGALLRKTSLDELPQLLQVLRGEMSLIGPRPIVKDELRKYAIYSDKLLTVKPGLSGMWQVFGRSDTTYPQRVLMDMQYIDHRCLWLDMQLIFLTVIAVLRKNGAC
jgi:lipopolysaccharide/colanic/teichoic acid biosynthesis glycosyltransferase